MLILLHLNAVLWQRDISHLWPVTLFRIFVVYLVEFLYSVTKIFTLAAAVVVTLFCIYCIFTLLSRKSDQTAITSSHRSCRPSVYQTKMGDPAKCFCQWHKLTCQIVLHTVPLILSVKQGSRRLNSNAKVAADLDDPVVFSLSPRQVTAPGIIFMQLLCAIVHIFGCLDPVYVWILHMFGCLDHQRNSCIHKTKAKNA